MKRDDIINQILPEAAFPLWVPLLTHYRKEAGIVRVDTWRMLHQARQVRPFIGFWMMGGTTGDGWALSDAAFQDLVDFTLSRDVIQLNARRLIGVLRPTTAQVLARIRQVQDSVGLSSAISLQDALSVLAQRNLAGITVCPPVGKDVTQEQILAHYGEVCEAARMPVVVYQLPQVTGNQITPDTMNRLVAERQEIILFKDSSGTDIVAKQGLSMGNVALLRGAEGDYVEALKPLGGYDGFLLSTGNTLGRQLRTLIAHVQAGRNTEAMACSTALTRLVQALFAAVKDAPAGNAFSNANRAVDHLLAYGRGWRNHALPLLIDGTFLPEPIVAKAAVILESEGMIPESGYLNRGGE